MVGGCVVPGDRVGQAGPAPRDARTHGTGCQIQDFGDLGVVEAGEIAQHDRHAELLREQRQAQIDVDRGGNGVGRIAGLGSPEWGLCGGLVLGQPGVGSPAATPEFVEARVGGHSVRPGGELGPSVEAGEPSDDRDQGLLGGIERVGIVAGEPPADRVDPVLVQAQEFVEGPPVPALSGRDQRLFVSGSDGTGPYRSPLNGP